MAHKSKSQRARATARKQARKQQQAIEAAKAEELKLKAEEKPEEKKGLFKKSAKAEETKPAAQPQKKAEKPAKKKKHFQFLRDVRSEMKRVTWPSRQDVLRWSGVVVLALLFFGIFTAVLDNLIITPALFGLSGLGA